MFPPTILSFRVRSKRSLSIEARILKIPHHFLFTSYLKSLIVAVPKADWMN